MVVVGCSVASAPIRLAWSAKCRPGAERLYGVGHQRSDRIERGHLASGVGAHLAVGLLGPGTEFAHVSEDQDGAPGKAAQYINRRQH